MSESLRLGVAGLGNVGVGLVKLVQGQKELNLTANVAITGVSARSRNRNRGVDLSEYEWFENAIELATSDQIDAYVELIGGSEGPAKETVEAAIKAGKHVVTANKALIAEHGVELAALAEEHKVHLLFEAAVAGGIPIVRAVRDSLSGLRINKISGILNGTCNYILSEMLDTGASYDNVLADAQRLGYAEADPWLDVSGTDAAHKIVILAAMAFGSVPDFTKVRVKGIDEITDLDIQLANKLGYRIRLVAEAVRSEDKVRCFTTPTLYDASHPLSLVTGPTNAVVIEGDPVGRLTFTGAGAGEGPTASAVMGDVSRLLQGGATPPFGLPQVSLKERFSEPSGEGQVSRWFLRANLEDKSGTLAQLSDALANAGVSIDKLMQDSAGESGFAPIAIITHACTRKTAEFAAQKISTLSASVDAPQLIRIEA